MEFRLLRADGTEMWVSDRGRVTRGKSGAATRITDVFMDITEKKRLEEKLREHEQRRVKIDALEGSGKGAGEREGRAVKREETLDLAEVIRAAVEGVRAAPGASGEALEVRLPARSMRVIADREELQRTLRDLLTSARALAGGSGQVTLDLEAEEQRGVATLTIRGAPEARGHGRGAELTVRLPLDPARPEGGPSINE
jgi:PAS domain-containing protein